MHVLDASTLILHSPEIVNDFSYWVIGRINKINHEFKFYTHESRCTYRIVCDSLMPNFCLSGFMSRKYSPKSDHFHSLGLKVKNHVAGLIQSHAFDIIG